jgi:acyl-CoA thioesterase-1
MRKFLALFLIAIPLISCGGGGFVQPTHQTQTQPEVNNVVFIGDSITAGWNLAQSFPGKNYVNRGVPGESAESILIRFDADVISAKPDAVVILAGTNSLEWDTNEKIESLLQQMYEKAKTNGIRVVACTITPRRADGVDPNDYTPKIVVINAWIRQYVTTHDLGIADYYPAMADTQGWLRTDLARDHVHPNDVGYAVMTPIASGALAAAKTQP